MKKGCATGVFVLACVGALVFIAGAGMGFVLQIPITLLFGWFTFLKKVIPHVSFDPAALVVGMLSIAFLFMAVQYFLRWFSANYGVNSEDGQGWRKWKIGWSFAALAIFVLMFMISISLTGLIHQIKWLRDEPMVESSWQGMRTREKMKAAGSIIERYRVENGRFPVAVTAVSFSEIKGLEELEPDAVFDEWGTPLQYCSDGKSYTLRSLGKNKVLGGGSDAFDDLIYCDGKFITDGRPRRR